ncbi:ABC transporter substrate-binding protein [Paucibacter sp. Y2R2-4]|uniref:ABC transporter substrate-binding protein n=1 Tax=Paucibacter sp. Y2R2-4 TaxID=2893553 RepID=UPI0021E3632B|nr:ABC transporter substrate-binding protein [Paucibacter sp. Y2R2-4]MCV2350221.1 ABC transporter substrate-binding protein [Paucibacter sp. Y2R2-4]
MSSLWPVGLTLGSLARAESDAEVSGSSGGASRPASVIYLGGSAALSGPAAFLGRRFHVGAQAHFTQLNRQGGVGGAMIALNLLDDAYETERAEANTRQLLDDPRTLALFGYVGTPTSFVALPYVRRAKVAFVGAYTGSEVLREPPSPYVFNVRASYADEGRKMVQAMKAAGVRTVNVMYQADMFGRSGLEAIKAAATEQGIQVLASATVKRNTESVADVATELVRKSKADAIFMVSTYATCAAFVKSARGLNYRGHFYTLSFAGLEPLREALGKSLKGVTMAQVVPDPTDAAVPVVAAYQQAMRQAGEKQFDSISLEGFIAARIMVEGLRHAKAPLTRASVLESLAHLGSQDLGGFQLNVGMGSGAQPKFVELKGDK